MSNVIELTQNAVISLEEAMDRLSSEYRDRFGYGGSVRVVPFVGWANGTRVNVSGRVLADQRVNGEADDSTLRNLLNMVQRYKTDEVADAKLRLTINGESFDLETDGEGYFDAELELSGPVEPSGGLIREYDIELIEPMSRNEQFTTLWLLEGQISQDRTRRLQARPHRTDP